jgi:hypothetical protein
MNKKHEAISADPKDEAPKSLATTTGGTLVAAPSYLSEEDFGGGGFEGAGTEAYALPFLQILQKMSPLVDEDSPKHVEGAKAGMFYNTVTGELFDGKEGLTIIPCAYKRSFIEWGGREGDAGYKGAFTPEQFDALIQANEVSVLEGRAYRPDSNGHVNIKKSNYLADTREHYALVQHPKTGTFFAAVIPLASTQTKASRMLMTMLNTYRVDTPNGKRQPPTFAHLVKLTTVPQSNDKGSWSGAKFELTGLIQDAAIFKDAKDFHQSVTGGEVKADHSKADNSHQETGVSDNATEAENF